MAVSAIQTSTTPIVGAASRDYTEMNDIDFMNLLVAQIQNQDPLSPMDNAEFTSQITQFSMLEQMAGLGTKLDDQILMSRALNNTAMLALVGRDVTVAGDQVQVTTGASDDETTDPVVSRNVLNATGAGAAVIEVLDGAGKVVATFTRAVEDGLNDITWDGKLDDGSPATAGDYTLRATVTSSSGTAVDATILMTGPVQGLRYENNAAVVTVNGEEFYVADIYQVS